jgi:hypothetical protein
MKTQGERSDGKPERGDPTSPQIADDHSTASNPVQLSDDGNGMIAIEMVKHLRAQNDIHAVVGEGELERVTADGIVQPMARRENESECSVHADRSQGEAASASDLTGAPGKVGETGTNVEQCRFGLARAARCILDEIIEEGPQGQHDGASASKERVGAFDVAMRPFPVRRLDIRVVENFAAGVSHRSSCA